MNAKEALRGTLDMSSMVMNKYIADLDDAALMMRPGKGCNHLAWQLGHLIVAEAGLLNGICPGASPELPPGFAEQHDKTKTEIDDPAQFCSKQTYVELSEKVRAATLAALDKMTETDLDQPSPEHLRNFCPTVGGVFTLLATHPLMHAGQVVPVRRALGKPIVM